MIELDENGQIPRKDVRCRAYHVAGYKEGKLWEGVQFFSGGPYPTEAHIEAYDTFCGWASPEISGKDRSTQANEPLNTHGPVRIRFYLVEYPRGIHLAMWCSQHGDSQDDYSNRDDFIAWVSDTMDPLPPTRTPAPPDVEQELLAMANQATPLTVKQRELLREVAKKFKGTAV